MRNCTKSKEYFIIFYTTRSLPFSSFSRFLPTNNTFLFLSPNRTVRIRPSSSAVAVNQVQWSPSPADAVVSELSKVELLSITSDTRFTPKAPRICQYRLRRRRCCTKSW
ncbi:hypothetical protein I3843_07G095000 [Carya illinoinensis]|uniref:uncharacterized protein LOC122317051 n=1 Tax=Carya illinoinensis TaxID=32201 RepID=UPI001C7277C0|nr:uncharacterized protein LOC122317051 [Carya illinoinensis]KAG7970633.1 hypothetical protein I3843_07G095000 [Carya illinoinensis]